VYSCRGNKNQGRFRDVGSDHSLVSYGTSSASIRSVRLLGVVINNSKMSESSVRVDVA
jgi:hypothetical protein